MPRADQAARDVCRACRRGVRADRLDQLGRCPACAIAAALAGLPPDVAGQRRRELLDQHYRREARLQAGARMLICPSCGRRRAWWNAGGQPLCLGCQVRRALADATSASGPRDL